MKTKFWISIITTISVVFLGFFFLQIIPPKYNEQSNDKVNNLVENAMTTNYLSAPSGTSVKDDSAKKYITNGNYSGSFLAVKNGTTVFRAANGFSNFDNNYYSNVNSKYNVGSLQFQFNAALLLKLVQQKKISIHASLKEIFPNLKIKELVTVQDILLCKADLGPHENELVSSGYNSVKNNLHSWKLIKYHSENSKMKINSFWMALIIQKVTRTEYSRVLQKQLLNEVPALSASVEKSTPKKSRKNIALSYEYHINDGKQKYDWPNMSDKKMTMGYGQLYMNVSDLYNSLSYMLCSNYLSKNYKKIFIDGMLVTNGTYKNGMFIVNSIGTKYGTGIILKKNSNSGVGMLLNVDQTYSKRQKLLNSLAHEFRIFQ